MFCISVRFNASCIQGITLKFHGLSHWEDFPADFIYYIAYLLREIQKLLD